MKGLLYSTITSRKSENMAINAGEFIDLVVGGRRNSCSIDIFLSSGRQTQQLKTDGVA